jgi:UDP-N-acetylglucosamine 3-dehydrogenase
VTKLKEIVMAGRLGTVSSVIARRVGTVPTRIRDMNVMVDLAVHDIDIISYLYESVPDRVVGNWGQALIGQRQDYAEVFLTYENRSGFIQVNWITPIKIRTLSVTGSNGYAELDYITQQLVLYESNYTREIVDELGDYTITFGQPDRLELGIEKEEPLYNQLCHFVGAIRGEHPVQVTGDVGLKTLELALRAVE